MEMIITAKKKKNYWSLVSARLNFKICRNTRTYRLKEIVIRFIVTYLLLKMRLCRYISPGFIKILNV